MWRVVVLAGFLGMAVDAVAAHDDSSSARSPSAQGADTSVLHRFERNVQSASEYNPQNNSQPESSRSRDHDEGIGHELGEEFVDGLVNVTMSILAEGGRSSLQRLDPATDASLQRIDGDPPTASASGEYY